MTSDQGSAGTGESKTITISYTKNDHCRTIIVDGLWGGIAPDGSVFAALYTQQQIVPSEVTLDIENEFGVPGAEPLSTASIGREIQAEIRMNVSTSRALGRWFLGKADEAEKVLASISQQQQVQGDSVSGTDESR